MFLLMFLVSPFDVLSILIEHIVFYRFVIGGALMRRSLSFPTSFAIHIFCFRIFTVIFSPIQGFFGIKIVTSSNWHVSTVGGALRRYRRGHGFKSRRGLNSFFFQVLFSLLLMQCSSLRSSLSFQIGERWRTQSCGKCTDNPTNQFKYVYCKPFLGSQSISSVSCQIYPIFSSSEFV